MYPSTALAYQPQPQSHAVSMVKIAALPGPSAFDLPQRCIVLLAFEAQVGEIMQGCRGGRERASHPPD